MPLVKIVRRGTTPAARRAPVIRAVVVMPMTMERIARGVSSEIEEPAKVNSLQEAFGHFQPKLAFSGHAGQREAEFRADVRFDGIKDFDPEHLLKRQSVPNPRGEINHGRNDLVAVKQKIDLLYRLKDRWSRAAVRRAWNNPAERTEIINAFVALRQELQKVASLRGTEQ